MHPARNQIVTPLFQTSLREWRARYLAGKASSPSGTEPVSTTPAPGSRSAERRSGRRR